MGSLLDGSEQTLLDSTMSDVPNRSRADNNQFKREKFAKAWVNANNMSRAAKMAGISASAGRKFIEEEQVLVLIEKERERIAKRMDLDADFVLGEIQAIAIECRADQNHKDSLKALELLGKHLKLFSDRETHTGATVSFNLSLDGTKLEHDSGATLEHSVDDHELDFEVPEELQTLSPEELALVETYDNTVEKDEPFGIWNIDLGDNDGNED